MVAQTAESFAQQQRFVADAAHELRTPLTAIGGSIEILQLGAVDAEPEKRRRLLASIGNEVDRLGRLVNDLLMLSHLDQQPPTKHEPLDLQPLLLDLLEQARIVAPQHTFVIQLPAPLPVCGNADQLRQVFLNLLSNASTYTPAGGLITVSGQCATGITISVADTGLGIPAKDLPYVWDRLYRVDRSRARARGGFGLGLAIVQTDCPRTSWPGHYREHAGGGYDRDRQLATVSSNGSIGRPIFRKSLSSAGSRFRSQRYPLTIANVDDVANRYRSFMMNRKIFVSSAATGALVAALGVGGYSLAHANTALTTTTPQVVATQVTAPATTARARPAKVHAKGAKAQAKGTTAQGQKSAARLATATCQPMLYSRPTTASLYIRRCRPRMHRPRLANWLIRQKHCMRQP